MSVSMIAARSPPRSEPANNQDFRPRAIPRSSRSAALLLRQMRPSSSRRCLAAKGTVVTDIGPNPSDTGLELCQHRYRSIITMNALGGEDVRFDQLIERAQCGRTGADMVGHGRD